MAVYDQDGSLWENGLVVDHLLYFQVLNSGYLDLGFERQGCLFLQVYHHSGIAFIMWGAVASPIDISYLWYC
jgi:hypothetical protein